METPRLEVAEPRAHSSQVVEPWSGFKLVCTLLDLPNWVVLRSYATSESGNKGK
jgi:hypothetical protein